MTSRMSLLEIGWTFLRIGALAFGGLGGTLALIESELVRRRQATSKEELTEALTFTKLLPGSTVVQVVAYLGWRLGGWPGSVLATTGFILPSAALMLFFAWSYTHVAHLPAVAAVRQGVLAVVVALLLVTLQRLAKPVLTTPLAVALALAAFILVAGFRINSVITVVAAGVLGIALMWRRGDAPR
ncbi:MAG: chromate transporter [Candidatus Rokuibacteriota bacterium]